MSGTVSLVAVDPDLVAGIPAGDRALAARVLTVPSYTIPSGRFAPGLLRGAAPVGFGFLILNGIIARQVDFADRHCMQLFGRGDVLQLHDEADAPAYELTWSAVRPCELVALEARFVRATQRWPMLSVNLYRRLLAQADRAALHAAIVSLPRIERRLLAIFWQLAERWGRVTPLGVEVPLELTHEVLGRLAGAQRSTVTLALGELQQQGAVKRSGRGVWLLDPGSHASVGAADARAAVAR